MQINYSRQSIKQLLKISSPYRQKIKLAIEELPGGDVIKLQKPLEGYRMRVGDYRVLFDKENHIIEINAIYHRRDAY